MGQVKRIPLPVFNSPLELGLRMVYLLQALSPQGADLQKLVLLDYVVVYSADLDGPPSLHTPIPFRGSELLSRRELIEQGLHLMSTRGLVTVAWAKDGISYYAGKTARMLTTSLTSQYLRDLDLRCHWAVEHFGSSDSRKLTDEFAASGHLWGAEIESVARYG